MTPVTAEDQRRILDAFHSRQATRYIEILGTLPPEQQPKSKPELIGDYLEFLTTHEKIPRQVHLRNPLDIVPD